MSDVAGESLILRDDSDRYYLVARELLEQCRLPPAEAAELAQQLAEVEVSGYLQSGAAGVAALGLPGVLTTVGVAPRDIATGQATGKRQWGGVRIA
jgi:hypothetical protein